MKKLLFIISIAVIASLNILAQGFRNPVLPGFHADPSVCTDGKGLACLPKVMTKKDLLILIGLNIQQSKGEYYHSSHICAVYPSFFVNLATIRTFASSKGKKMETERILLRPWQDSDAETLFKYASDPDVGPRAGWPPHATSRHPYQT